MPYPGEKLSPERRREIDLDIAVAKASRYAMELREGRWFSVPPAEVYGGPRTAQDFVGLFVAPYPAGYPTTEQEAWEAAWDYHRFPRFSTSKAAAMELLTRGGDEFGGGVAGRFPVSQVFVVSAKVASLAATFLPHEPFFALFGKDLHDCSIAARGWTLPEAIAQAYLDADARRKQNSEHIEAVARGIGVYLAPPDGRKG